jgi:hypothetical protein
MSGERCFDWFAFSEGNLHVSAARGMNLPTVYALSTQPLFANDRFGGSWAVTSVNLSFTRVVISDCLLDSSYVYFGVSCALDLMPLSECLRVSFAVCVAVDSAIRSFDRIGDV